MSSLATDNPMVRPQLTFKKVLNLDLIVIDTKKRDALENALLTLDSLADDLLFDEADEVVRHINEAFCATDRALARMEG